MRVPWLHLKRRILINLCISANLFLCDPRGILSNILTRTVYVVDQTPLIITLEGNESMVHDVFSDFLDPGATAIDGVGRKYYSFD